MNLIIINTQRFDSQNINGLESCGLLVDFCDVFISGLDSFLRHPFTAEDPLVRKWCNATFLQICSDEETNSSVSWMAWVNWLNYSLRHFFLFKKIKELFGLRQWFATLKKKPCFSLSCSFTCFFALFIIHFLSIILSISGYLFSWACWFICAPNAQYLPMHSVSIRWTAEGMHSA